MGRAAEFARGLPEAPASGSYAESVSGHLPKCVNCGEPVSVKGVSHTSGPNHHFWSEDVHCEDPASSTMVHEPMVRNGRALKAKLPRGDRGRP